LDPTPTAKGTEIIASGMPAPAPASATVADAVAVAAGAERRAVAISEPVVAAPVTAQASTEANPRATMAGTEAPRDAG
jgi:hypothetical protein